MRNPASANARKPGEVPPRDNTNIALSASWHAFRYTNGSKLIAEITALGFHKIELSFNLTPGMVKDIEKLVQRGRVEVVSVHNFCPIPDGVARDEALPDYYALSSEDEERRRQAVLFTKKTIDTARMLHAKAVVLHTGRVEIPDRTRRLINLYSVGEKGSAEYEDLKQDMHEERRKRAQPFFDATLKSLDELSRYAEAAAVALGIETRFYYREIPSFEEIGCIFKKMEGAPVFYWHDTGHAQVMENLGFTRHENFLQAYGSRMLGMHIHNVVGCSDHQAPSAGEVDFNMLKPYVTKQTLKVIEAHYPASPQELVESRELLENVFDGLA